MGFKVIDGKSIANQLQSSMKEQVESLINQGILPGLAVILIGSNVASHTYVRNKQKSCEKAGIRSVVITFEETVAEETVLEKIKLLNQDQTIHGILVQLPLPPHISEEKVIQTISPLKDVDGFHPENIGKMFLGQETFLPCTPFGIITLLDAVKVDITGKHVVILGRSNIVGKPAGQLFLNKHATVTICHSKSENLETYMKQADILVVAIGKPKFVRASQIKEGAIVIDVGMNRDAQGKLCGDVDYEEVKNKTSYITPVPGGVGPMTITMLMHNTIVAAGKQLSNHSNATMI